MVAPQDVGRATCAALLALGLVQANPPQTHHTSPKRGKPAGSSRSSTGAHPEIYQDAIRENDKGMALMERHDFTEALARFERACVLNPQSDTGCLNMGIALLNMGQFDEAATILKKSAERDPDNRGRGST